MSNHIKTIAEFPDYEISEFGRVFNKKYRSEMILSENTSGDLTVGLYRNGIQYRRSVKVLVAMTFVSGRSEIFDTPIQLDGNKRNLRADNIVWRPRWFAWKYSAQFKEPQPWFHSGPVVSIKTRQVFDTILDVAKARGELCAEIVLAIANELPVFPSGDYYVYYRQL